MLELYIIIGLESKEVQDWKPQDNCFYCSDRIQLLFVSQGPVVEI